ncbi:hypothetical protein CEXT_533481 [Caerostris extrusa]|uniref:Uncharacterized protein n=1 Tax=Caerostris extrusa TaxID=172846 RepID=A0AAV4XUN8_CAEEX|nr:hypothetical protein CEXT_533481 [Caerostris extrusa]
MGRFGRRLLNRTLHFTIPHDHREVSDLSGVDVLDDIPANVRYNMWFQHNEAPAHFGLSVRSHLNGSIQHRWIECGRPVPRPPCLPNLSILDFFRSPKAIVYHDPM